jgi:uncharacterized protein YfaT (DUF1175 family)
MGLEVRPMEMEKNEVKRCNIVALALLRLKSLRCMLHSLLNAKPGDMLVLLDPDDDLQEN